MTPFLVTLLKFAAIAAPLGAAARWLRVAPRIRLVYLALLPAVATFALPFAPQALWLAAALDAIVLAVALADAASLPRTRELSVERTALHIASLRKPHAVTLTVLNHGQRTYQADLRDGVPHELCPEPAEFNLELTPRSRSTLHYVLRPRRRGAFTIEGAQLRIRSRWGLWQRIVVCPVITRLAIYPDIKQLSQYALLARTNRLSLMGVRRTRRVGQDHDFERLRDYTRDDNYKHLDWRATARRRKLTVRDYQTSQSQRIIFMLDCGRMMTNEAEGISLFDHALNASLLLSYVALRQGDQVGMITFSDSIHGYIPPRGGMQQMNRLLHASFNRFPELVESRYDLAFRYLAAHCRQRALVVLVTNVIDEVNANQIQEYLGNLVGRHLPLGVLLRDRRLFDAVDLEHPAGDDLWRAAAAADILTWRHQVLSDLHGKGVLSLDVFPENMTAPLVNRYLEIKARHLL